MGVVPIDDQPIVRVVFLDIDGVLNSERFFEAHPWPEGASWWSESALDPRAVAQLDRLLRASGAAVVLSSSWRKRVTLDELNGWLTGLGLSRPIVDATPRLYRTADGVRPTRGDEIAAWMAAAPEAIEAFIVLEDEEPLGALEARCVRTDPRDGLTERAVDGAIALLAGR